MTAIPDHALRTLTGATIPERLAGAANRRPADVYARWYESVLTIGDLAAAVDEARAGLAALGVVRGTRVAVLLPNHLDHVVTVLALIAMRAVWVPVNPRLRGRPLAHVLGNSDPGLLLIDTEYAETVADLSVGHDLTTITHRRGDPVPWRSPVATGTGTPPVTERPEPDDVISIMYTSGTTGPAKGVQVTDRMLRAAAAGAELVGQPRDADVFFVWEPLCHVGGAQMLLLPLLRPVSLALVERFSASRFWEQVEAAGATHIHHLGGIISMLLGRSSGGAEAAGGVRVCWGGGMTAEAWTAAERRFGLRVHECYGMTEASSISTVNTSGVADGIGRQVPWFDVQVHDEDGKPVPDGVDGEIVLRPRLPGLLTPGYFRDDRATAKSRRGPWWRTGDRGRFRDGALHFAGRLGDAVRHRGENVSAWEVESVVNTHPAVAESAVVGVPAAEGEEDVKIFVTLADDAGFDPAQLVTWCEERLASFQVPRYVAVVETFPKTPSQRVRKADLSRQVDDAHDRLG